jgi:serine/threonine protein phosphatase PrpC
VLKEAFRNVDQGFYQEWQLENHVKAVRNGRAETYPGCTALAVLIAGGKLFAANAGDARAVLARGTTALPLSRQHTAELADEKARVEAAGGKVNWVGGTWRVGDAALQVTRALGDFDLKRGGGVIADPEVVEVELTEDDHFVVLGTDGLWDVLADAEVVGLVRDTVKEPSMCAKRLVMEALSRGSNDNVSAVVVFLQPVTSLEQVWTRAGGLPAPDATATFYGTRRSRPVVQTAGECVDEVEDTY